MRGSFRFFMVLLAALMCAACAGSPERPAGPAGGVYHFVEPGESLWSISRAYGVDVDLVARVNGIDDPRSLSAGDVLFIPGAQQVIEGDVPPEREAPAEKAPGKAPPRKAEAPKPIVKTPAGAVRKTAVPARPPRDGNAVKFVWPVHGEVLSPFGRRADGMVHNGIRIGGEEGSAVVASASGTVIHSAGLKFYGGTVIIRHEGNYNTVYAYLKERMVKVGDRISQGETIARLGKDDREGIPCLHFEIRRGKTPRDPLYYLPPLRGATTDRKEGRKGG
jgi:lipoprotein NlpD